MVCAMFYRVCLWCACMPHDIPFLWSVLLMSCSWAVASLNRIKGCAVNWWSLIDADNFTWLSLCTISTWHSSNNNSHAALNPSVLTCIRRVKQIYACSWRTSTDWSLQNSCLGVTVVAWKFYEKERANYGTNCAVVGEEWNITVHCRVRTLH